MREVGVFWTFTCDGHKNGEKMEWSWFHEHCNMYHEYTGSQSSVGQYVTQCRTDYIWYEKGRKIRVSQWICGWYWHGHSGWEEDENSCSFSMLLFFFFFHRKFSLKLWGLFLWSLWRFVPSNFFLELPKLYLRGL